MLVLVEVNGGARVLRASALQVAKSPKLAGGAGAGEAVKAPKSAPKPAAGAGAGAAENDVCAGAGAGAGGSKAACGEEDLAATV